MHITTRRGLELVLNLLFQRNTSTKCQCEPRNYVDIFSNDINNNGLRKITYKCLIQKNKGYVWGNIFVLFNIASVNTAEMPKSIGNCAQGVKETNGGVTENFVANCQADSKETT